MENQLNKMNEQLKGSTSEALNKMGEKGLPIIVPDYVTQEPLIVYKKKITKEVKRKKEISL